MGELTVRTGPGIPTIQYQSPEKAQTKPAAGGAGEASAVPSAAFTVSETLGKLMEKLRPSQGLPPDYGHTVRKEDAALAEIQDKLEQMEQLAERAARGEGDPAQMQAELEKLRGEIERILDSVVPDGSRILPDEEMSAEDIAQVLRLLLEKVAQGYTLDQAITLLTNGRFSSFADFLGPILAGAAPDLQALLMNLLQAAGGEGAQGAELSQQPQQSQQAPPTQEGTAQEPAAARQLGQVEVRGGDLSGVSQNRATGEIAVGGREDVTLRGTGKEGPPIRLTGSGQVTLEQVKAPALQVEAAAARLYTRGESVLGEVRLEKGTQLYLGGEGLVKIGLLRGDGTNTLHLTGGAVELLPKKEGEQSALPVQIVLEGPASLAGTRAVQVVNPQKTPLEPFDIVWKALLPDWSGIDALEVDGRQTKLALLGGNPPDPARLWLEKGDLIHGFPAHILRLWGRDKAGRPRTRYAYLRWSQVSKRFEEAPMYPNPFAVTGGEPGEDWVYDQDTQTLHILSAQVRSVSGGAGVDANQSPFSGRIALADGIGALELVLEGVVCRVSSGRAFSLGRENDVTLLVEGGTENLFESGAGCAGISLGDGTSLSIGPSAGPEGVEGPAGNLTATIGVGAPEGWGDVLTMQVGEESVTLPRLRLTAKSLQLDKMNVSSRERAQEAQRMLAADRRWVSQIQAAYGARYGPQKQSLLREAQAAGVLLREMRQSMRLQPDQALRTHSQQDLEDLGQLLG